MPTGGIVDPEVLKKAPLFARLDDEAASAAAAITKLTKGEVLFTRARGGSLYVVISGKIARRSGSAGRENCSPCSVRQMFGELSCSIAVRGRRPRPRLPPARSVPSNTTS
jgi:hypothetical protein